MATKERATPIMHDPVAMEECAEQLEAAIRVRGRAYKANWSAKNLVPKDHALLAGAMALRELARRLRAGEERR